MCTCQFDDSIDATKGSVWIEFHKMHHVLDLLKCAQLQGCPVRMRITQHITVSLLVFLQVHSTSCHQKAVCCKLFRISWEQHLSSRYPCYALQAIKLLSPTSWIYQSCSAQSIIFVSASWSMMILLASIIQHHQWIQRQTTQLNRPGIYVADWNQGLCSGVQRLRAANISWIHTGEIDDPSYINMKCYV